MEIVWPLWGNQNKEMNNPSKSISSDVLKQWSLTSVLEGSRRQERNNRPMWSAASNEIRMSYFPTCPLQPCPLRSFSFLRTERCVLESPWSCLVKWQAPSPSPAPGWSSESRSVKEGAAWGQPTQPPGWTGCEMLNWEQHRPSSQGPRNGRIPTLSSPSHHICILNNTFPLKSTSNTCFVDYLYNWEKYEGRNRNHPWFLPDLDRSRILGLEFYSDSWNHWPRRPCKPSVIPCQPSEPSLW